MRTFALIVALLAGCSTASASMPAGATSTEREPVNYCALVQCEEPPAGGCETCSAVYLCCHWSSATGDFVCVSTTALGDCDPDDFPAICYWGQSNVDGTVTCYD